MSETHIEYHPPSANLIEQFVKHLSDTLAHKKDAAYAEPSVIYGLIEFLKLVGRIEAKRMNRLANVDTDQR